jgi:hypothetical protein
VTRFVHRETARYRCTDRFDEILGAMQVRSIDILDLVLAWKRVMTWAQGGVMDVPDRLPFEVLWRVYKGRPPTITPEHHLSPVSLVMSSKASGTSRPFVRTSPRDILLYQALVDRLAGDIESALPSRDTVFAYRQALKSQPNAFADTPSRTAYHERIGLILEDPFGPTYSLTTDIAGYYFHVNIDELERLMLTISTQVDVVSDLVSLLRGWQMLGVRGLPQGLRPSAPLGNLFLLPLDRLLLEQGVNYVRWMDDLVIGTAGFHEARRIQDEVERLLYERGLTLASDKTRILRWDVAIKESEDAQDQLARLKQSRRESAEDFAAEAMTWADYPPDEPEPVDPEQIDREATVEQYDQLLAALDEVDLPKRFQSRTRAVLRDLTALKHPHSLDRIPHLLMRAPDLIRDAVGYVAAVARSQPETATAVFSELLASDRFMRDIERLELCRSILALPPGSAPTLATSLGNWALEARHPLVRSRALLAWGAQSRDNDFAVADKFWRTATAQWQPYVLVAVQGKEADDRNKRYARWSSSGRFLGSLATLLRQNPIGWRKL